MTAPNDGWIEWSGGGKCPVGRKVMVETRFRPFRSHPDEQRLGYATGPSPTEAGALSWKHDGTAGDIIAYRVVKP